MKIVRTEKKLRDEIISMQADPTISQIAFISMRPDPFHAGHDSLIQYAASRCDKVIVRFTPEQKIPFFWLGSKIGKMCDGIPVENLYLESDGIEVKNKDIKDFTDRWDGVVDLCYREKLDKALHKASVDYAQTPEYMAWAEGTFTFPEASMKHVYVALRADRLLKGLHDKLVLIHGIKNITYRGYMNRVMGYMAAQGDIEAPRRTRIFSPLYRDAEGLIPEKANDSHVRQLRRDIRQLLINGGWDLSDLNDAITTPPNIRKKVTGWDLDTFEVVWSIQGVQHALVRVILYDDNDDLFEDFHFIGLDETKAHDMNTLQELP